MSVFTNVLDISSEIVAAIKLGHFRHRMHPMHRGHGRHRSNVGTCYCRFNISKLRGVVTRTAVVDDVIESWVGSV